jgi:hypothetical protein
VKVPEIHGGLNYEQVRQFAISAGLSVEEVDTHARAALISATSRVMLALHRERIARVSYIEVRSGRHFLVFGEKPRVCVELECPPVFGDITVAGLPMLSGINGGETVQNWPAFLEALRAACPDCNAVHAPEFAHDFENSFANLVLNRVLYDPRERPLEPVWTGHTYYPFPGLRLGPDIPAIVRCSNVTGKPAEIALAVLRRYRFESIHGLGEEELFYLWSGRRDWSPGAIPVHPWQLALSSEVRAAQAVGLWRAAPGSIEAFPLASQRTVRVSATRYDLKLPADIVLTGEHRLLFPVNVANAPAVSALADYLRLELGIDLIEFQRDLASLAFDDEVLGRHLCVIIRAPVLQRQGETVVPALSLWANSQLAEALFKIDDADRAGEVFSSYCRVMLHGPLAFYARAGMAFEPHLQNALICIRNGLPRRLVLRDLDATILEPELASTGLRRAGLRLPAGIPASMPTPEDGRRRLIHSLLYANIAPAALYLIRRCGLQPDEVQRILDRAWDAEINLHSGAARDRVVQAREEKARPKLILTARMKRQMELVFG